MRWALLALVIAALSISCTKGPTALVGDDTSITLRDHTELLLGEDGAVLPLHIGGDNPPPLTLCLAPPASIDTSQWQIRLHLKGQLAPGEFSPPTTRLGATLCFSADLQPWARERKAALCGELADRYDGRRQRLPCQSVVLRGHDAPRQAVLEALVDVLSTVGDRADPATVARLRELQQRAITYPLLHTRLRLVASFFARRSGDPMLLDCARRDLADAPPWLDAPPALAWKAQWRYESAALALEAPADLQQAWIALRDSERAYRTIAHPKTIAAAMKRSEVLTRLGNATDATHRLDAALRDCATARCDPLLLPYVRNTLAWALLMQADPDTPTLAHAKEILEDALITQGDDAPLERANIIINLALHAVRDGASPTKFLAKAAALLDAAPNARSGRAGALSEWATLVSADYALLRGNTERVQALARPLAGTSRQPRVAAWAFSLLGREARQRGALDEAASAFEAALILHAQRDASGATASASAPGLWADDVYRTARVAVERGRAEDAWQLLASLDDVLISTPCPAVDNGSDQARYTYLLGELAALQAPASGPRRAQQRSARRILLDELLQLSRDRCPSPPAASSLGTAAQLRAFALPDEILLLHRQGDSDVQLYRRTTYARSTLRADLAKLESAMARTVDDRTWRALAKPLAEALAPRAEDFPADIPLHVALHGPLQRVPLEALPTGDSPTSVWVADALTVTLGTGGVRSMEPRLVETTRTPLFVVNPSADLRAAASAAPRYRRWFPSALVLSEQEARYEAVKQALAQAEFIHVDAHAIYDPAFPGLSQIRLAGERGLLAQDLVRADAPYAFVNLSACDSGRWPESAGSGVYGLGGAVARASAAWVIAARAPLADEVAATLNNSFYQRLRDGADPVSAYRFAHAQVRQQHPASRWGPLMLLGGVGGKASQR
ncbi:MAG: CHAT domain-containing protein [Pseudomonadota bacterium]